LSFYSCFNFFDVKFWYCKFFYFFFLYVVFFFLSFFLKKRPLMRAFFMGR